MEHSRWVYGADFVVYGLIAAGLAGYLFFGALPEQTPSLLAWVGLGLIGWTALEYVLHRYVLHHVAPFQRWHTEHHRRPLALIGTPTAMSTALIALLVFAPALLAGGRWRACALTLGLLIGYLLYSSTHLAIHHLHPARPDAGGAWWPSWLRLWLQARQRWHALHHHSPVDGCYGVTTSFWDHLLRSSAPADRLRDRLREQMRDGLRDRLHDPLAEPRAGS